MTSGRRSPQQDDGRAGTAALNAASRSWRGTFAGYRASLPVSAVMADVHDLQVSECLEAPGPAFHAYAAPLEAAEGLARDGGLMRVDPDGPGLDRSCQGRAAVGVARPDRRTEPEMRVVGAP